MTRSRVALPMSLAAALALACSSTNTPADTTGGSAGTSTGGSADTTGGSAGTSTGGSDDTSSDAGTSSNAGAPNASPPYANVTAVVASGSDGDYTFNVTVESADVDCSQFADWWEVLSEDGVLLYRRILEHSHTDENGTSDANAPGNTFTRSGGPVPAAADDSVLVRAHMSVGGYDGQVMRGTAASGFAPAADITANFAADVETADPLPTGCEF
jgi:hypothetical protein